MSYDHAALHAAPMCLHVLRCPIQYTLACLSAVIAGQSCTLRWHTVLPQCHACTNAAETLAVSLVLAGLLDLGSGRHRLQCW